MKDKENVDNIKLNLMSKSYLQGTEYPNIINKQCSVLVRTLDSHTDESFLISTTDFNLEQGVSPII